MLSSHMSRLDEKNPIDNYNKLNMLKVGLLALVMIDAFRSDALLTRYDA
jgi:hypothetical protein